MSVLTIAHAIAEHVASKPIQSVGVNVILPDEDDAISAKLEMLGYADGQSFAIEYLDSARRLSLRRITVWGVVAGAQGVPSLIAFCHERKAQRQFRVDRIQSCVDYDGEVFSDVPTFLAENFGMEIGLAGKKGHESDLRWRGILDTIRHDAVLLAALSRSDGKTVAVEVDIASNYLSQLAERQGVMLDDADILAIYRYANRLRPAEDAITRALHYVRELGPRHVQKLLLTAVALMDADGNRHPHEIELVNIISSELIGTTLI